MITTFLVTILTVKYNKNYNPQHVTNRANNNKQLIPMYESYMNKVECVSPVCLNHWVF